MDLQTENPTSETAERVDLTDILEDTTSALNALAQPNILRAELCAKVVAVDLNQVFATSSAATAIKRAYLTVPHIVEHHARNYMAKLFRELARSPEKGKSVLDANASTYEHVLSNGQVVVAQAETVEVEGQFTRRLMISLKSTVSSGAAA